MLGYQEFDDFFMQWIPNGKLAQRIFARLKPTEAALMKVQPASASPQSHGHHHSNEQSDEKRHANTQAEIIMEVAVESTKFDLTRSCDYVYRAKWLQRCGKTLRMAEIDGKAMVSVVDMIHIHGECVDFKAAQNAWSKLACKANIGPLVPADYSLGKEELKNLKIHEIAPVSGGKPVTFVSFLDFELHVLPQIKKGLGRLITSKVYHTGVGAHLGSQKVMDLILDAREQYEALVVSDPNAAAILWELKEQYEKIDTLYLDDVFEAQFNLKGPQGYVYLATSAHLNAVKIGHWGGSVEDLRKRYATYFGSSLSLEVLHVANRKAVEKHLHNTFAEFRLENELFQKDKYEEYYRCLNCMKVQISTAATPEPVVETEPTPFVEAESAMEVFVESKEFDLTRSCDYVYRVKWLQQCGKSLRMAEIDGKAMVSVVDMMYIHGDFKTEASCRDRWREVAGKANAAFTCFASNCGAAIFLALIANFFFSVPRQSRA